MKLKYVAVVIASLAVAPQSQAAGWLDSIKGFLGMEVSANADTAKDMEAEKASMPNISDMVASVANKLGVSDSQATGGLASIFNYAKNNLSVEQFSGLTESLPGLSGLLNSVPDVESKESSGGLGGLMDKAANYNDSLKTLNDVKKQFEALGLKPEMIMDYVNAAKTYLDTEEGKKIKETLMQGLSKLTTN